MGEVYLAEHPRLPRQEALKILSDGVSADPEFRARFAREADLAARLWHPHIVAVHDRGEDAGKLWISMDFIDGSDAAALLANRYPAGIPRPLVVQIVSAIADALDYAHDAGLLHRDVKPANVLLSEAAVDKGRQRIVLADFGIARPINDVGDLTATNVTVGTVNYIAPEQLVDGPLDGRADQYALAATAYHLLTGAPPFVSSSPAVVIGHHLQTPPTPVSSRHPALTDLDGVLAKALAKSPADRYPRCRDFAEALRSGVNDASAVAMTRHAIGFSPSGSAAQSSAAGTVHAVSQSPARPPETHAKRKRNYWLIPVSIVAVLLTVVAVIVGTKLATSPLWSVFGKHTNAAPGSTVGSSTPVISNESPITTPGTTAAPPISTAQCGLNNDADEVRAAMSTLDRTHPTFAPEGSEVIEGNFDPCATMSTVLVYAYGASGSSPRHALMFHKGQYVGTATPDPYSFLRLDTDQSTDSTVVLDFRSSPASCNACDDAGAMAVRFRWNADHIDMIGTPPSIYRG